MGPWTTTSITCLYLMASADAFSPNKALFQEKSLLFMTNIQPTPKTTQNVINLTKKQSTRSEFISATIKATTAATFSLFVTPINSKAFDGGVGGLGKVKPETGVVFRDDDATMDNSGGGVSTELIAPDGTPVLLSFDAPWPLLKSTSGIESRGLSNPEAAFVQVAPVPSGVGGEDKLPVGFFAGSVFGPKGKFGAYGAPADLKVKKTSSPASSSEPTIYTVSFTTLTPAMRESERKAFISAKIVGDGVFMLVTGSTAVRFKSQEKLLRDVAESFRVVPAPKSSLRNVAP